MSDAVGPEQLTEAEKEVLRLWLTHQNNKEVARIINRSSHEVERRMLSARRKLGVHRTRAAAGILALYEGDPAYKRAAYGDFLCSKDTKISLLPSASEEGGRDIRSLFPVEGRPWNAAPIGLRLAAIVAGALALAAAAVLMVSLGQALSGIARH